MKKILIGMILVASAAASSAQVVSVADRATFDASGSIAYNTNFASFGAGFGFPGTPYTAGDVTYVSSENLTVGSGAYYSIGSTVTVMSNNYWSPLTANVGTSTHYTLLGFDAAVTSGPVNITISTNQNTYHYNGLSLPDGSPNFAFEGFHATGSGEYFTGFRIDTLGGGYLPGITNVAVGVAAVPEPETYGMLLAGLGLVGLISRRKKAAA